MTPSSIRVRFAPSPTGHLHIGNVRTALYNWLFARNTGGTFILRLEDTDAVRSTEESVASVLEDLRWLGLNWDEGPEAGGDRGPYRQTERRSIYHNYLKKLLNEGNAYYCFCTQEELEADRKAAQVAKRTYTYPGTCRHLSVEERNARIKEGRQPSIRLKVPPESTSFADIVRGPVSIMGSQFGDWILARPDGSPTYNFAVVIDDALMGITHVIRGEDHLSNTPKQVLLYNALGFAMPRFAHISMVLGPDGSKLSKRHGDVSVDALRRRGFLPDAIINGLALMGWSDAKGREVLSVNDLVESFDLGRAHKAAAVFDEAKLRYLNKEHLKRLAPDEVAGVIRPWLVKAGRLPIGELSRDVAAWLEDLSLLLRERIEVLSEAREASDPVFLFNPEGMDGKLRESLEETRARSVVEAFLAKAEAMDLSVGGVYKEAVLAIRNELGVKGRALYHPIRLALTAAESGPDLERLVPLLEKGSRLGLPSPVLSPSARLHRVLEGQKTGS